MGNKKAYASTIGILTVFIITFNLLAFLLVKNLSPNFWSGYAFVTVAWISVSAVCLISFKREYLNTYSFFLTAPQILVSLLYLLFELIAGISVMLIPNFSVKAGITIQSLLLSLYLCIIFGLIFYKSNASKNHIKINANRAFRDSLSIDVEGAILRCKSPIVKTKLNEIRDLLRFSDPVSCEAVLEKENRIYELFTQISSNLYEDESRGNAVMCDEIIALLKQRAIVCANSKKY